MAECLQRLLTKWREISADQPGEKRQGKRDENWEEKKENCKREGGKVTKWGEDLFFFFFFFFLLFTSFKTTQICFWVYQNACENFYRERAFLPPHPVICLQESKNFVNTQLIRPSLYFKQTCIYRCIDIFPWRPKFDSRYHTSHSRTGILNIWLFDKFHLHLVGVALIFIPDFHAILSKLKRVKYSFWVIFKINHLFLI